MSAHVTLLATFRNPPSLERNESRDVKTVEPAHYSSGPTGSFADDYLHPP